MFRRRQIGILLNKKDTQIKITTRSLLNMFRNDIISQLSNVYHTNTWQSHFINSFSKVEMNGQGKKTAQTITGTENIFVWITVCDWLNTLIRTKMMV